MWLKNGGCHVVIQYVSHCVAGRRISNMILTFGASICLRMAWVGALALFRLSIMTDTSEFLASCPISLWRIIFQEYRFIFFLSLFCCFFFFFLDQAILTFFDKEEKIFFVYLFIVAFIVRANDRWRFGILKKLASGQTVKSCVLVAVITPPSPPPVTFANSK